VTRRVLIRPSGTEPVLRVMVEARDARRRRLAPSACPHPVGLSTSGRPAEMMTDLSVVRADYGNATPARALVEMPRRVRARSGRGATPLSELRRANLVPAAGCPASGFSVLALTAAAVGSGQLFRGVSTFACRPAGHVP